MDCNKYSLTRQSVAILGSRPRCLSLLSVAWLVNVAVAAFGQVDDEDLVVVPIAEQQVVVTDQQFDQMICGSAAREARVVRVGNGVQRIEMVSSATPADLREQLESTLASTIQSLDAQCSLTDAQKKKLGLAGKGDIHQFFSRIVELRPRLTAAPISRERYTELMNELQPVRTTLQQGLFGENSLFRKTLRRTLTNQQHSSLQRLVRQSQREAIEIVLRNLDHASLQVKLNADTRQEILDALIEHGRFTPTSTPYMQYIVLLEANRLEMQLKPLLNDASWQTFQKHVALAKRFEPTLRKNGLWPVAPDFDDDSIETSNMK